MPLPNECHINTGQLFRRYTTDPPPIRIAATGGSPGKLMEWTRLFLEFISDVAWPLAIATIAIVYRKEIRLALTFVRGLEFPGGFKAIFTERVATEEQLREAVLAKVIEGSAALDATSEVRADAIVAEADPDPPNFNEIERKIVDLAVVSPGQAVLEIRAQVLLVIRSLGPRAGLGESGVATILSTINALADLDNGEFKSFSDMLAEFDKNSIEFLTSNRDNLLRAYVAFNFELPASIFKNLSLIGKLRILRKKIYNSELLSKPG